jgi:hypothetical protein
LSTSVRHRRHGFQAKLKTAQDARDKGIVTTGCDMTVSTWHYQW